MKVSTVIVPAVEKWTFCGVSSWNTMECFQQEFPLLWLPKLAPLLHQFFNFVITHFTFDGTTSLGPIIV